MTDTRKRKRCSLLNPEEDGVKEEAEMGSEEARIGASEERLKKNVCIHIRAREVNALLSR